MKDREYFLAGRDAPASKKEFFITERVAGMESLK
jgi:hypothetical protein